MGSSLDAERRHTHCAWSRVPPPGLVARRFPRVATAAPWATMFRRAAATRSLAILLVLLLLLGADRNSVAADTLRDQVAAAMRKAAGYYRDKVAAHGGYVYHYALDLSRRWGEG